ncbi:MAG TPA: hypothetical protein EYN93_08995 [Planctomycetaceae bacterium]|nr:hypothetical protein [Planctomycetaceae bacterium]
MAKQKAHYWKKNNPRNPVPLNKGGFLELEIISQHEGIVQVTDPEVQEELVGRVGTYGLTQIEKAEYDKLKKNRLSTSLGVQQREELGGIRASANPAIAPRPIDVDAVVEGDDRGAVFAEAEKALPLPEDYKPKASKRSKLK